MGHNSSTRQPGDYPTAGTWAFVRIAQDPPSHSEAGEHTLLQGSEVGLDRDPISLRDEGSQVAAPDC